MKHQSMISRCIKAWWKFSGIVITEEIQYKQCKVTHDFYKSKCFNGFFLFGSNFLPFLQKLGPKIQSIALVVMEIAIAFIYHIRSVEHHVVGDLFFWSAIDKHNNRGTFSFYHPTSTPNL